MNAIDLRRLVVVAALLCSVSCDEAPEASEEGGEASTGSEAEGSDECPSEDEGGCAALDRLYCTDLSTFSSFEVMADEEDGVRITDNSSGDSSEAGMDPNDYLQPVFMHFPRAPDWVRSQIERECGSNPAPEPLSQALVLDRSSHGEKRCLACEPIPISAEIESGLPDSACEAFATTTALDLSSRSHPGSSAELVSVQTRESWSVGQTGYPLFEVRTQDGLGSDAHLILVRAGEPSDDAPDGCSLVGATDLPS